MGDCVMCDIWSDYVYTVFWFYHVSCDDRAKVRMLFRSLGQCCDLCTDCGNLYTVLPGKFAGRLGLDGFWHIVGDNNIRGRDENRTPKAAAKMDGRALSGYGLDTCVHIAGNVASYICARHVVYSGGRPVV